MLRMATVSHSPPFHVLRVAGSPVHCRFLLVVRAPRCRRCHCPTVRPPIRPPARPSVRPSLTHVFPSRTHVLLTVRSSVRSSVRACDRPSVRPPRTYIHPSNHPSHAGVCPSVRMSDPPSGTPFDRPITHVCPTSVRSSDRVVRQSFRPFAHLASVLPPVRPTVHQSARPTVRPLGRLSGHPTVHLSRTYVRPSVRPFD